MGWNNLNNHELLNNNLSNYLFLQATCFMYYRLSEIEKSFKALSLNYSGVSQK